MLSSSVCSLKFECKFKTKLELEIQIWKLGNKIGKIQKKIKKRGKTTYTWAQIYSPRPTSSPCGQPSSPLPHPTHRPTTSSAPSSHGSSHVCRLGHCIVGPSHRSPFCMRWSQLGESVWRAPLCSRHSNPFAFRSRHLTVGPWHQLHLLARQQTQADAPRYLGLFSLWPMSVASTV
jgi:hypothetical protein